MNHRTSHSSSGSLIGVSYTGILYPRASGHRSPVDIRNYRRFPGKGSCIPQHDGNYKSPGVRRQGKRVSFASDYSGTVSHGTGSLHEGHRNNQTTSGGHHGWTNPTLIGINEKETMQYLNERLAAYLGKVRSLEQKNGELEENISEWYSNNAPRSLPDSSHYLRTIQELQNQVSDARMGNARILLQIDNAQLAAEDLKCKYEMEMSLRNSADADLVALRRGLEQLNSQKQDLEIQVKYIQEELLQINSNHEQEVTTLRGQLGARITVEMEAAPSIDLNKVLSEVRQEYENLMEKNLKEVAAIFHQRTAELDIGESSGADQLVSVNNDVIDLRLSVETLEIEFQSQKNMKSALEETLAETEASFGSQLSHLQSLIDKVESQLGQYRPALEQLNNEYRILMDQKTHLEKEIATYKQLLDDIDSQ
ncbi:keratin, type I cytoskeletal 19-like [Spea bombifrons]|uniref:keratin, type I cytoskeletal 19-like n=1 Tax=Spea bombifrons TaxID=233779 RepID=UPI00234ADC9C|nr:keratin, type I cytoskeletal 19-like [Spea bombifrons]